MIVSLSFGGTFFFFSWHARLSLETALSVILDNLFPSPHVNGFYGSNEYVYLMMYCAIVLALLLSKVLALNYEKSLKQNMFTKGIRYKNNPFILMVVILVVITTAQFIQHFKYFVHQYSKYSDQTMAQKKISLFGFPYIFAMNCKNHLKGYHAGKFITDMDISRPREMSIHRLLAYYLYPIKIRNHRDEEQPDCLVFFAKKDAINNIPEDYVVRYQFDTNNLLAVRRTMP